MKTFISALCLAALLIACGGPATPSQTQLDALAAVDNGAVFIDVRTPEEVAEGAFDDALKIPHEEILPRVKALELDKNQPIILYCRSGNRAGIAATALREAGFTNVTNAGGYEVLANARNQT